MSAASFLHSSFLQAVNAVMLRLVRAEKVPQASEHLCPAKLQIRCDICSACQSICLFIPTDSGVPRTVDPQKSLQPKTVPGGSLLCCVVLPSSAWVSSGSFPYFWLPLCANGPSLIFHSCCMASPFLVLF